MNPQIDHYLIAGCGRCSLYNTPDCKVHSWEEELALLRAILLTCDLAEELKWKVPCYTFEGSNILLMSAFKEYCAVSFFKGALLKDEKGLLVSPGDNSQAVRMFRITGLQEIIDLEPDIRTYVKEAVEVEKAGLKIDFKEKHELEYPPELEAVLAEDPVFKAAFEALTPGRQRGYNLYFSQPKQSRTRIARIEKFIPKILEGKGFHDR